MARTSIEIDSFQHQNPIPAASRCGPLIESSIIPAFDPGTRNQPSALEDQIANLFIHMGQMLEVADASWDDVVKITFFVTDPAASKEALTAAWLAKFPDPGSRPARHNLPIPGGGEPSISCVFTAYVER